MTTATDSDATKETWANPHLIGPIPRTTSATTNTQRGPRALPDDLLRDASRRLGILSLVAGGLWLVATVLGDIAVRSMAHGDQQAFRVGMPEAIAAFSIVVSVLLFFYTRRGQRDPRTMLDLGLVYMVLTAVALGLVFHWNPLPMDLRIAPEISWIGAVVLMFAAIVPSTRAKTLVAGLIAVSMNPMAMLIARARGTWNFEPASTALLMHYPDYLLVGVAVVISHIVTTLGQQVAKAREMGSYQIGELLGRGGMGEVYKATHRMLARPAAIKLIRPEMIGATDPAAAQLAVTRFRREAQAAANLRSPHTVELYDFGVTDDQTLYFVMELLDGMDLDSLVRQHGPVPAGRAVHLLTQVCASLDEAHVRGLVHRDIKPANIHVGRLGLVHDFVKVLDFGLVKPIADRSLEETLATQAGLVVGTPGYMAPEMVVERHRRWTRRPLRARLRRLLRADRAAGLRRRHDDEGDCEASAGGADPAVATSAERRASRVGAGHPRLPREEARGSTAQRRGACAPACRRRRRAVDERAGGGVVGDDGDVHRSAREPGQHGHFSVKTVSRSRALCGAYSTKA